MHNKTIQRTLPEIKYTHTHTHTHTHKLINTTHRATHTHKIHTLAHSDLTYIYDDGFGGGAYEGSVGVVDHHPVLGPRGQTGDDVTGGVLLGGGGDRKVATDRCYKIH